MPTAGCNRTDTGQRSRNSCWIGDRSSGAPFIVQSISRWTGKDVGDRGGLVDPSSVKVADTFTLTPDGDAVLGADPVEDHVGASSEQGFQRARTARSSPWRGAGSSITMLWRRTCTMHRVAEVASAEIAIGTIVLSSVGIIMLRGRGRPDPSRVMQNSEVVGHGAIGADAVWNGKGKKDLGPVDRTAGQQRIALVDQVEDGSDNKRDDKGTPRHAVRYAAPASSAPGRHAIHAPTSPGNSTSERISRSGTPGRRSRPWL